MAFLLGKPAAYAALCALLCICSLQTTVTARRESSLKLDFYAHEVRGGANSTLLSAAGTGAGNMSQIGWGTIFMFDNMVREGESPSTKLIGKVTGTGAVTSTLGMGGGIQVISKVSFNEASKYNGSSFTLSGTIAAPVSPWEVIVLGGTGYFRGIKGYAFAQSGLATPPIYTTKWEVFLWK